MKKDPLRSYYTIYFYFFNHKGYPQDIDFLYVNLKKINANREKNLQTTIRRLGVGTYIASNISLNSFADLWRVQVRIIHSQNPSQVAYFCIQK